VDGELAQGLLVGRVGFYDVGERPRQGLHGLGVGVDPKHLGLCGD
jgi:hypothetical protein